MAAKPKRGDIRMYKGMNPKRHGDPVEVQGPGDAITVPVRFVDGGRTFGINPQHLE